MSDIKTHICGYKFIRMSPVQSKLICCVCVRTVQQQEGGRNREVQKTYAISVVLVVVSQLGGGIMCMHSHINPISFLVFIDCDKYGQLCTLYIPYGIGGVNITMHKQGKKRTLWNNQKLVEKNMVLLQAILINQDLLSFFLFSPTVLCCNCHLCCCTLSNENGRSI